MDTLTHIRAKEMAAVMKALAHPARIRVMELLAEARWSVSELSLELNMDMSSVSKNLSILKNAGLAYSDKEGTRIFYYTYCKCIQGFHECVRGLMQAEINRRKQILNS